MDKIMLCVDAESARSPELIGLDGVDLGALSWLIVCSDAQEARALVSADADIGEVWVASSDDMPAVNLAAAIKRDRRLCAVFVVMFEVTGSAASRARAAGVNGLLTRQGFVRRFASARACRQGDGGSARADDAAALDVGTPRTDEGVRPLDLFAFSEGASGSVGGEVIARDRGLFQGRALALPKVLDSPPFPSASVPFEASGTSAPAEGSGGAVGAGGAAFVLSVVSGSGGAGKSSVAMMAAHAACSRGLRTVLVDCDLQFGDLHLLAGEDRPLRIDEVLANPGRVPELSFTKRAPALIAAPDRLEAAEDVARDLPALFDALGRVSDVVVVNTGASWAEHHAVVLESSSCALFLVDQRLSSVRACKHALDLCGRCGIATSSFAFVVNRCARGALLTSIDVSCALQGARVLELKEGGPVVEELLGAGLAGELAGLRNDFVTSVDALVGALLPGQTETVDLKEHLGVFSPRPMRRFFGRKRAADRLDPTTPSRGVGAPAGACVASEGGAGARA